jgi:hypothetical protein
MDIYTEESTELFGLTPLAEGLRSDVPGTLKAWAIQCGQPSMWEAYGRLKHSIMTGESAFRNAHGLAGPGTIVNVNPVPGKRSTTPCGRVRSV